MDRYGVLVFLNQTLSKERKMEFSREFGEREVSFQGEMSEPEEPGFATQAEGGRQMPNLRAVGRLIRTIGRPRRGAVRQPPHRRYRNPPGGRIPNITPPTASKCAMRDWICCVSVWMSRNRRSNGLPGKIASVPAALKA